MVDNQHIFCVICPGGVWPCYLSATIRVLLASRLEILSVVCSIVVGPILWRHLGIEVASDRWATMWKNKFHTKRLRHTHFANGSICHRKVRRGVVSFVHVACLADGASDNVCVRSLPTWTMFHFHSSFSNSFIKKLIDAVSIFKWQWFF